METSIKSANSYFKNGKYEQAHRLYLEIIHREPHFEPLLKFNILQCKKNLANSGSTNPFQGASKRIIKFIDGEPGGMTSFYRVQQIVTALKTLGVECRVIPEKQFIASEGEADIFVFVRCTLPETLESARQLASHSRATLVYDCDDLLFRGDILAREFGISSEKSASELLVFQKKLDVITSFVGLCDFFTSPTDFLANQASEQFRHIKTLKIKNYPPEFYLDEGKNHHLSRPTRNENNIKIFYFSGSASHQLDVRSIEDALLRVLKENDHVQLFIVGKFNIYNSLRLIDLFGKQVFLEPYISPGTYYKELPKYMKQADLVIAPLDIKKQYVHGKSELKFFEAGAFGVPFVGSESVTFTKVIRNGETGYTCLTSDDWYETLSLLVKNDRIRKQIGRRAFEVIQATYSTTARLENVTQAYQNILNHPSNVRKIASQEQKATNYPANQAPKDCPPSSVTLYIEKSGLFCPEWYCTHYADLRLGGVVPRTALQHYVKYGMKESRDPNPYFDASWYRARYMINGDINVIKHYMENWSISDIDPSLIFSTRWYIDQYGKKFKNTNPLSHYLNSGKTDGAIPHYNLQPIPNNIRSHIKKPYPFLSSLIALRAPPSQYLRRYQAEWGRANRKFADLKSYFNVSFLNPRIIRYPFNENDIRVISMMDDHKRGLISKYKDKPQDVLISVIMPTRNRADCIVDSVLSVLAQSYKNIELIVIDDASDDGTEGEILDVGDNRIKYVRLNKQTGNAGARDAGVRNSRGHYLAYLDDDDYWDPDFLLIMVNALRDSGARFGYSAQLVWRGYDALTGLGIEPRFVLFSKFNRSLLENSNYISMITCMHTRDLYDKAGGFDVTLNKFVDWDLFLKFTEIENPIAVPCILSHYMTERFPHNVSAQYDLKSSYFAVRQRFLARNYVVEIPFPGGGVWSGCAPRSRIEKKSAQNSKHTNILIPNYEALGELKFCVNSILQNTEDFTIIIIDNGSTTSTKKSIREAFNHLNCVKILDFDEKKGFTYAVNYGLRLAADGVSDVVVLNNDAIVTKDWLIELRRVVELHPEAGMVVPRQCLLPGNAIGRAHMPSAVEFSDVDINLSAHHGNIIDVGHDEQHGYVEVCYAPMFCVYMNSKTAATVRKLDVFNGPHYRSDWIFCNHIRFDLGMRIVYTPWSVVYHLQGVSSGLAASELAVH